MLDEILRIVRAKGLDATFTYDGTDADSLTINITDGDEVNESFEGETPDSVEWAAREWLKTNP